MPQTRTLKDDLELLREAMIAICRSSPKVNTASTYIQCVIENMEKKAGYIEKTRIKIIRHQFVPSLSGGSCFNCGKKKNYYVHFPPKGGW